MSREVLVHVGYHKTATTWFQKDFFTERNGYARIADHDEVDAFIVRPVLSFSADRMQALAAARIDEVALDALPVLSSEILVGNPFFGGREKGLYAHRLKMIFPEARILVTIRAQPAMMRSLYMQYVSRGGTMRPARFFAGSSWAGYSGFDPEHLEYDRLVQLYVELFGEDRVLVLTQESVQSDPDGALDRLARFGGVPGEQSHIVSRRRVGESAPEYAVPLLRRVNHLREGPVNREAMINLGVGGVFLYKAVKRLALTGPVKWLFGGQMPVRTHVPESFLERFRESNRRLAHLTRGELDLSDYP